MLSIDSSSTVPALVPTFSSGATSNASTPSSTAPTTPTSEASIIDFRLPSYAKSRIWGLEMKHYKSRTSSKSVLNKTNNKLKQQSHLEPSIVIAETSEADRVSMVEIAARLEDIELESGLDIPCPSHPSQVSLILLHDGDVFPSPVSDDREADAEVERRTRLAAHRHFDHAGHKPLPQPLVISTTEASSPLVAIAAALRCLFSWWSYIIGCVAVCTIVTMFYGVYWALALPIFCFLHPCSPVWQELAVFQTGARSDTSVKMYEESVEI